MHKKIVQLIADFNIAIKKGIVDIAGAGIINKLFMLMTTFVVIRVLTKEDYGLFSYAYNFINVVAVFSSLGMNAVMLQYASEQHDSIKRQYIYKYTFIIGTISCIFFSLLAIVYSYIIPETLPGVNPIIRLFSFVIVFQFLYQSVINYFRAELNNKLYRRTTNINSAAYFAFASLGAYVFSVKGTVLGRYFGFIIASAFGLIFIGKPVSMILRSRPFKEFNRRSLVGYGLTITLTNAVSQILYSLDVLLVGMIIGSSDAVADYKTATIIPFALAFIPQLLVTFIYPHFARNNYNLSWIKQKTSTIIEYLFVFNLLISIVGFVFAPTIIKLAFGDMYMSSVTCFRILMISYLFSGSFRTILGNVMFILHKVKVNMVIGIVDATANIILDIILIMSYGSVGAAIATMSITILDSSISGIYLYKYLKKHNG